MCQQKEFLGKGIEFNENNRCLLSYNDINNNQITGLKFNITDNKMIIRDYLLGIEIEGSYTYDLTSNRVVQ